MSDGGSASRSASRLARPPNALLVHTLPDRTQASPVSCVHLSLGPRSACRRTRPTRGRRCRSAVGASLCANGSWSHSMLQHRHEARVNAHSSHLNHFRRVSGAAPSVAKDFGLIGMGSGGCRGRDLAARRDTGSVSQSKCAIKATAPSWNVDTQRVLAGWARDETRW